MGNQHRGEPLRRNAAHAQRQRAGLGRSDLGGPGRRSVQDVREQALTVFVGQGKGEIQVAGSRIIERTGDTTRHDQPSIVQLTIGHEIGRAAFDRTQIKAPGDPQRSPGAQQHRFRD